MDNCCANCSFFGLMDEGDFEVRFRKFALLEFLWVD